MSTPQINSVNARLLAAWKAHDLEAGKAAVREIGNLAKGPFQQATLEANEKELLKSIAAKEQHSLSAFLKDAGYPH
jgi:hypothetical protein